MPDDTKPRGHARTAHKTPASKGASASKGAKKTRSHAPRKHDIEESVVDTDVDKEIETSAFETPAFEEGSEDFSNEQVLEKEAKNQDDDETEERAASPARPAPHHPPEEDFAIQVYYDRQNQKFYATCLEFPDLKVDGSRRDLVVEELSQKIGDELEMLRRDGGTPPVPYSCRTYPEKLDVRVSNTLYRRLDIQSRVDRVPLDQLVSELLTQSLNKRAEGAGRPQQEHRRGGQQQHSKGHQNHGNHNRNHHGNHRGGGGGGGGGNRNNRNYHDTMAKPDNFLEYVRNLEKGGGFNKKR